MKLEDFQTPESGELIKISGIEGADHAFIPAPLPPNWQWPLDMWQLLMDARIALAGLDGIGRHLPNPQLLLRPLQFREAVRSNSLEGTYTQPLQQALFELDPEAISGEPIDAYREISNYARALRYYFESRDRLPLSMRLVRELHGILMNDVRGADKEPGEFRRLQVHIGRPPRYIPPPPQRVWECLDTLEKYWHKEGKPYDPLIDAFLVHYQFEAIHPFRDGNGRVGRLLLSIMVKEWCNLSHPWLHMSAFFDDHKQEYIDHLYDISTKGDWRGWVEFCLRGVIEQANDTEKRCERLLTLNREFKERLQPLGGNMRVLLMLDHLFDTPIIQIPYLTKRYEITYPTAKADVDKLVEAKVLEEVTNTRQKTFVCPAILNIIYDL